MSPHHHLSTIRQRLRRLPAGAITHVYEQGKGSNLKLHQWTPDTLVPRDARMMSVLPRGARGLQDPTTAEDYVSPSEAFAAAWERENLTAEIVSYLGTENEDRPGASERPFQRGTSWNPYAYISEAWDEERQKSLDLAIRSGIFEDVRDPVELEAKAAHYAREMELVRRSSTPGVASYAGALAGALTDPISYLPLAGPVGRLRGVGRIGKGVLLGTAGAAVPEIGLQQLQDLRTAEESFLNIGVGALLGGGVGTFAKFMDRRHPMNPAHPDNPLHPDNIDKQPTAFRNPGVDGGMDVIDLSRSVGAAETPRDGVRQEPGLSSKVPGLKWVGEKIDGATPAGRALQWSGVKTRGIIGKMMDLGGRTTNLDMAGVATRNAESIKRDLLVSMDVLFEHGEHLARSLNRNLGQSAGSQFLGRDGVVPYADFNAYARRKLLKDWASEDSAALVQRYGEQAAEMIEGTAERYAAKIHEVNALYERELVEIGKLRDPALVEKLSRELDVVRNRIKQRRAQRPKAHDVNADTTGTTAEAQRAADAEVSGLRQERDRLQALIASETQKPAPMGEGYGHAQLYDPSRILAGREAFQDELMHVLADNPDEDWLLENYSLSPDTWDRLGKEPVTVGDVELTIAEGQRRKDEILELWTGDQDAYRLHRAQLRFEAAKAAHKQATEDLSHVMRAVGLIDRKATAATLSEARKKRDLFAAQVAERQARIAELRLERDAFKAAAEAARTVTLERQLQDVPIDLSGAEAAVRRAEGSLLRRISDVRNDPATPPGRVMDSGDVNAGITDLARAERRLQALIETSPEPRETPATARSAAKAQTLARELHKAERQLARMEARLETADDAFARANERAEILRAAKKGADDALADIRKSRKLTTADLSKASRALLSAQKRTPLYQAVEDITNALVNREALPRPVLDKIAIEPGRAKARRIHYTPEQRRAMEEKGFLRSDLPAILRSQYESLSGYIGLHRALDIGEGRTFASWDAVREAVSDDYRELVNRAGGDADRIAGINKERASALKDLGGLKDRLLGTENVGMDRDGWAYWLSSKVRQANLIRFMAGFLIPSLTDIASVHLRTGSLAKLIRNHGRQTAKILKDIHAKDPSMFTALVHSVELGSDPRLARAFDADDTLLQHGIGVAGTTQRKVTAAVDEWGEKFARAGGIISGMRTWNRFWKIATGIYRAQRLRDMTADWSKLSAEEVADLSSLGIGKSEAERITRYIERYGETTPEGHWDPNLESWLSTADGREAARDFRMAVSRDMDRAVFTPGIGDTPLVMSHGAGKLWLQFQTYAFTFMNRFLVPASQRLARGDHQALVSFAHLTWSALVVVMAKDIIRGEDPEKRLEPKNWSNTAFEIVDRSGVMAYLSPYVDAGIKASGPLQEAALGRVMVGPTSRYARNSWSDSLLGASFGLYRDMRDFGTAVASGDAERIGDKGMLLVPFNTYARGLMNQLEAVNSR